MEKTNDQRSGGYVSMSEEDKKNANFEAYYRAQEMMDSGEFDTFMETLKMPLPTTFRITGNRESVALVKRQLESEFVPKLTEISKSISEELGKQVSPPEVLSWYPNGLAYQFNVERSLIRKAKEYSDFHRWLVERSENGDITRQEAVSMIPPMLLDIEPHHLVLDVCAAPGSKTSQLVEKLHSNCPKGEFPTGAIVANDLNKDRAYMLFHQLKRFDSPSLMVCNHDGAYFPNLFLDDVQDATEFDRILADVPCTGDGTLRKNIDVWKNWSPRAAFGLQPVQIRILERCLTMLKVGGRIVYSTCSFNPIENEAVVAYILKKYTGKVKIVDVSEHLNGLKYRQGLKKWKTIDKNLQEYFHPEHLPIRSSVDSSSKIPLSAYWLPEYENIELEKCVRILPHDQNSGGFFITLLEKVAELNENEKARGGRRKDAACVESETCTEPSVKKIRPNPRYKDEEPFFNISHQNDFIKNIVEFFGLDRNILERGSFLIRSTKDVPKSLYFVSNPIGSLIKSNSDRLKVINTGVKCFEAYDNKADSYDCPYRLNMDALPVFLPLMSKRIFKATAQDLLTLLDCDDSILNEVFSQLLKDQIADIATGSCVFILDHEAGQVAIPIWARPGCCKAFVARPDRSKIQSYLSSLLN